MQLVMKNEEKILAPLNKIYFSSNKNGCSVGPIFPICGTGSGSRVLNCKFVG
jgi:hypothetical protein